MYTNLIADLLVGRQAPQKFNQDSYDKANGFAIDIITAFLKKKGYTIIDKEEDYTNDIDAINSDGELVKFEAEVKDKFFTSASNFPFPSVSFAARKKKYGDFWYIIVSTKSDYAVACHSSEIFKDEYAETVFIDTTKRYGDDYFHRVPNNKCHFFKIR